MTAQAHPPLAFSRDTVQRIFDTIGSCPPESGGILGAGSDGIVAHFYYDHTGERTEDGYAPDISAVNDVLENQWLPKGVYMVGIVHSHAHHNIAPSCGDIAYGIHILQALDTVDRFFLPIVTKTEEHPEMHCYEICYDLTRQFICRKIAFTVIDG